MESFLLQSKWWAQTEATAVFNVLLEESNRHVGNQTVHKQRNFQKVQSKQKPGLQKTA